MNNSIYSSLHTSKGEPDLGSGLQVPKGVACAQCEMCMGVIYTGLHLYFLHMLNKKIVIIIEWLLLHIEHKGKEKYLRSNKIEWLTNLNLQQEKVGSNLDKHAPPFLQHLVKICSCQTLEEFLELIQKLPHLQSQSSEKYSINPDYLSMNGGLSVVKFVPRYRAACQDSKKITRHK